MQMKSHYFDKAIIGEMGVSIQDMLSCIWNVILARQVLFTVWASQVLDETVDKRK